MAKWFQNYASPGSWLQRKKLNKWFAIWLQSFNLASYFKLVQSRMLFRYFKTNEIIVLTADLILSSLLDNI